MSAISQSKGLSLAGLRIDLDQLSRLSEVEQETVREELKLLEDAARLDPLLVYRPHEKQVVFHSPPFPPIRLFLGGNRSGKTTSTMVDTIIQAVDTELVPEHLRSYKRWDPPFFGRVITPDLTNTLEGVVLQKFRDWCPKGQLDGGAFEKAWDKQLRMLRFKNGSWIQFFSNDQDLDKFGGAALHRVVYDESPRHDLRKESLMRLIDYGGEELFGLTPLDGMSSWLHDEFYVPWENGELPDDEARLVLVDMDDNPHLDEATKTRVLKGLSAEERDARKSGKFVAFSGLIYQDFQKHIIPQLSELPAVREVFVGIDPGIRHMCAVLFAYLDESDMLVVFDEIAAQGQTIREVCESIALRCERWKIRPNWYVIDPAARNKNNQTGRSDQSEFLDNGIVTIPGQNAVTAGINRVKERLEAGKLKVCANCHELRGEFKKYRWTRDSSRSENEAREAPVKKDDHLLDALRYVVMQRPLVPERERELPSDTMKDRLLRHALKAFSGAGRPVQHDSGPGIFQ